MFTPNEIDQQNEMITKIAQSKFRIWAVRIVSGLIIFGVPLALAILIATNPWESDWIQLVTALLLSVSCLFMTFVLVCAYLQKKPVERPYVVVTPHLTTPLSENDLSMARTSNEHFYSVAVNHEYITTKLQEVRKQLMGGGITDRRYQSLDQVIFDRKMMEQTGQESTIKPIIAALTYLGETPEFEEEMIVFAQIELDGFLKNGDKVLSINGKKYSAFNRLIAKQIFSDEETIHLLIEREGERITLSYPITKYYELCRKANIFMRSNAMPLQELPITAPPHAKKLGDSAGLAKSLEILQQYGGLNLTRGRKIAVTGSIQVDGKVIDIGGLAYKYITVVDQGFDVFVVPKIQEDEMNRYLSLRIRPENSMEIIYADSLDEAVKALQD